MTPIDIPRPVADGADHGGIAGAKDYGEIVEHHKPHHNRWPFPEARGGPLVELPVERHDPRVRTEIEINPTKKVK